MRVGIYVAPQEGASYEDQLRAARAAEEHGFDAFVRSDHYVGLAAVQLPGPTDSWITLAGLARETSRIELGTMVSSATFRLPGPFAIIVAQVDAMSGGRVVLGLGAGWSEDEHRACGIPYPPLRERFDRLEEQLAIVRGVWSTPVGETFDFDGRYYHLEGSPALPKPVRRPHPPIIVGGTGAVRTPALAARYADEFNLPPFQGTDATREAFARVSAACEAAGRDPATLARSVTLTTVCGTDEREVERRGSVSPLQYESADLAGTPAAVAEQLAQYAALGADCAYLRVLDLHDLDHIALLGTEVLPSMRT
ncbi:MAG: LLM class F420-dependent oxidoreductase [Actinobacteria bacterium]|nr:MAG: LLM class F420-dependent oxidoreductase [Actinomycetota bacterium]